MKKYLWPFLLIILALTGCTRFYAPGVGGHGLVRLDTDQSPADTTKVVNRSHEVVFIDLKGRTTDFIREFYQIKPGQKLTVVERSFRVYRVTLAWVGQGFQDQIGYSEEKLYFSMPALYTGTPLIIDDLMLRNATMQRGIVYNVGDPTTYLDNQGHSISLASGDSAVIYLRSGVVKYYAKPAEKLVGQKTDPYYSRLRTYEFIVSKRKGQYTFNNELYDFRIVLKERWMWR
ncbi:MAG: hypothetical protein C3F02_01920 [Parcubacteria group bacterium]|nr:MAG: hypothetical protein C3F02_01920 [Parcubacteria group bacterium]